MLIPPFQILSTLTVAIFQTTYQPIGGENLGKPVQIHHCGGRRCRLLSFWGVVSVTQHPAHVCGFGLCHRLLGSSEEREVKQRGWLVGDREKSRDLFCCCRGASGRYGAWRCPPVPRCSDIFLPCE